MSAARLALPEGKEVSTHKEDNEQQYQQAYDPTEGVDAAPVAAVAESAKQQDDEDDDDEEYHRNVLSSSSE